MKRELESGFGRVASESEITGEAPKISRKENAEEMDLKNLTPEQMDQIIIDNAYVKPGEATLYPKGYLDRVKELRSHDFSEANSWQELYAIVASKGGVTGSGGEKKSAQETLNMIDEVRRGDKLLVGVTRTGGLRDKVRDLWLAEHDKATRVSAEG